MSLSSQLSGFPNGVVPVATLDEHLRRLAADRITFSRGGNTAQVALIQSWHRSDNDFHVIQFDPNALRLLEELNDPRLALIKTIFSAITVVDPKVGRSLVQKEMQRRGVRFLPLQVIRRLVRHVTKGKQ